ncbi:site-specific DNA-methyltransferase [Lentilactobacillus curieae]|uniref:Methyltransferase n=1 Tax=Lentilactobacillus curieae TaxID=1138822 RepID=A0A1S6QH76_9LACO|nr:site-specific DNA-methyltransferase [Lentilactobacillus curieae]AQW20952.1 site-specific DNA-methyltransferase [Lentilactobacillus curieae]
MKEFYKDQNVKYILGDSFDYLKKLPDKSIDLIVTDPPYFLSNGGFSNSGGKKVSVNKGSWDDPNLVDSEQFYSSFLEESFRVLKDNGTLWIFGTMHNIYTIGYLLPKLGFKILNNVTWQKSNPAPNLSRRMFTHSTETILWAKKQGGKQLFNYDEMRAINGGKQMKDVWTTSTISKLEKRFGKHPTQKPLSLMLRILKASANTNMIILDPFVGSGTTAVAGKMLGMKVIGVDESESYLSIAKNRVIDIENERVGKIL